MFEIVVEYPESLPAIEVQPWQMAGSRGNPSACQASFLSLDNAGNPVLSVTFMPLTVHFLVQFPFTSC